MFMRKIRVFPGVFKFFGRGRNKEDNMGDWGGLNRRKFPRVLYPCLVEVRASGEHQDMILAHTENLGTGGICVIMRRELKIFSPVDIELDLLDMGEHIRCHGKVVWSIRRKDTEPTKPMFFDVGIEFENLPDPEQKRIDQIVQRLARYSSV
jgi:hypothetical protein